MKSKYNKSMLKSNPEVIGAKTELLNELDTHEKSISMAEFRKLGYLQELNRLFLHPLGLSMVVKVGEDENEYFFHIADYRDTQVKFDEDIVSSKEFQNRIKYIQTEFSNRG